MKIEKNEEVSRFNPLVILTVIFVFLLVAVCGYVLSDNFNNVGEELAQDSCSLLSYQGKVSSDLEPILINMSMKDYPFEGKKAALEEISKSEDPNSYSILVTFAKCKSESLLQYSTTELLLKKIQSQNNAVGAKELGRWFEKIRAAQINPTGISIFGSVLEVFNKNQNTEYRKKVLAEIFASDPQLATSLAAALNFDEGQENFTDILKVFIAQSTPGLNLEGRSVQALMIGNANLAKSFEQELKDSIKLLSDEDLLWVLRPLINVDNALLPLVIEEIQKKNLFNTAQKAILEPVFSLKNNVENNQVKESLLRLALGNADRQSFAIIGRWYSPAAEKVLLLAIPLTKDPELGLLAFDILAGRSIQNKTAEILIHWLKAKHWDKRKEIYPAIAVLSAFEFATNEEIEKALDNLLSFVKDDSFFEAILQTKQDKLILMAIPKFAEVTYPDVLITLLKNKNKDIRMAAVRALKGHNELIFLQEILDAYRSENNEEVRKIYQENHWVTENRGSEIRR